MVEKLIKINNAPVELNESDEIKYTSGSPGVFKIDAYAYDEAGNEGYSSKEIKFIEEGDETGPFIEIISPEPDTKLTMPTKIIGTVSDENLIMYKLEYSVKDENNYTEISRGTEPVKDGVLGIIDPTLMKNGLYDIRLTAEDKSGNMAVVTTTYQIEGGAKIGNFTLSYEDMLIPVAGIPITIIRTYDSRIKNKGDFGVGWTLSLNNIKLSESCEPGKNWEERVSGGIIKKYYLTETKPHIVTITYPNGKVEEFETVLSPYESNLIPIAGSAVTVTVSYKPKKGTYSKLEALTNNECYVLEEGEGVALYSSDSLILYNPDRYKLTEPDGTVYIINQHTGLESITDIYGNTIILNKDGIRHSSGKEVVFDRDSEGRITSITDPMGNKVTYEYDYYGDLVSVTDQEGNTTKFTYNSNHYIISIMDPRGKMPVRNEYDDDGRLIARVDAEGNRIEYSRDIENRQEIVEDRMGNITVYNYDEKGNIIEMVDPMGNKTTFTFDSNNNKLSETDALGNTIYFTYDSENRVTSKTDQLGNKIEYYYNSSGQIESIKEPNGNVIVNTFDDKGNLVCVSDSSGKKTIYNYDNSGNLVSIEDAEGNITRYTYDSNGLKTSETSPSGKVTMYQYDENGNQVAMIVKRTTADGEEEIVTRYAYDKKNRLVKIIDHYGGSFEIGYNEIGKKAYTVDEALNRTEYEYDDMGNLIKIKYADGTEESYSYDANGNKTSFTDRLGRKTVYSYDKLGRLVKTTYPDGAFEAIEYDAVGNIVRKTDERGNSTLYTYDAAGRNISVTDALGNTTLYEYDSKGNVTKVTDANGNITMYEYDMAGRNVKVIYSDGTFITNEYDTNGNKISETDQAGKTTKYEYSPDGNLIKVTDALNNEVSFEYDQLGNLIAQIDANGNITKFEYDKLGRKVKRTLPMVMSESFEYDSTGLLVSYTDFNGNTIKYEYDKNGRLAKKLFPDGTFETYTYTLSGKKSSVTDGTGKTTYEYDLRDRLVKQVNPDGTFISYTYDASGNRTSIETPNSKITYSYDKLNRLETVEDNKGNITKYSYDSVGNRKSVEYPNGSKTEYEYDTLNRLVKLTNKKSTGEIISSYSYDLGPSGNRTKVTEHTGRTVDYVYDDTYKLLSETIKDSSGTKVIEYTYDAFGNRLTKTDDGVTTVYEYDKNNRLTSDGTYTYSYDNNGNTLSKTSATDSETYSYDYENRLVEVKKTSAAETSYVKYLYNANGVKVGMDANGKISKYLVDINRDYSMIIEETDEDGSIIVKYVYGDDLISQEREGAVSYYHYDGTGSTRALTDTDENITDTYDYDAFGNIISKTGTTINEFLFTGEQYDFNTGFYNLRARWYNPYIGRFLSADKYSGTMYDPRTLHKYTYCGNDPVNNIDPSGYAFTLIELSITVVTMETIYISYANMLFHNLIDTANIAACILEPAMAMQHFVLENVAAGHVYPFFGEMYAQGRELERVAYREMIKAWRSNYESFAYSLAFPIKVKIFNALEFDVSKIIKGMVNNELSASDFAPSLAFLEEVKYLEALQDVFVYIADFFDELSPNKYDYYQKPDYIKAASKTLVDVLFDFIDKWL